MADLRTQKTLNSLKNAFLELLSQYRFEEITILQLCQCARIRRATFYTHFADKYEFLSFFIQEMRDEFAGEVSSMISNPSREETSYYDQLFHKLILFFESHPQLVRNLKNSQMLPAMTEIFTQEVQKSVFQYLQTRSDGDERTQTMKACFYAGGILQLLLLWMKDPEEFRVDEINWLSYLCGD